MPSNKSGNEEQWLKASISHLRHERTLYVKCVRSKLLFFICITMVKSLLDQVPA